jgi:regulator of sigma D
MGATQERGGDRRSQTREMAEKLLAERREMLVRFCQVAGLEPYSCQDPALEPLSEFCQVLMDYMAFGHFEIYDRISRGEERRASVMTLVEEVYPRVLQTTDVAVAFNDKYDASEHPLSLEQLPKDLSQLGEELATRIELEDRLLAAMMM